MKTIGILNGPNLNRLGKREPHIYGNTTLADLEQQLKAIAKGKGVSLECFQSNHEGELIDKLQQWADAGVAGVVFNPGAYTHTSIALLDAIKSINIPVVEVHISNIYKREEFRRHSLTAQASTAVISGLGLYGYQAALEYLCQS